MLLGSSQATHHCVPHNGLPTSTWAAGPGTHSTVRDYKKTNLSSRGSRRAQCSDPLVACNVLRQQQGGTSSNLGSLVPQEQQSNAQAACSQQSNSPQQSSLRNEIHGSNASAPACTSNNAAELHSEGNSIRAGNEDNKARGSTILNNIFPSYGNEGGWVLSASAYEQACALPPPESMNPPATLPHTTSQGPSSNSHSTPIEQATAHPHWPSLLGQQSPSLPKVEQHLSMLLRTQAALDNQSALCNGQDQGSAASNTESAAVSGLQGGRGRFGMTPESSSSESEAAAGKSSNPGLSKHENRRLRSQQRKLKSQMRSRLADIERTRCAIRPYGAGGPSLLELQAEQEAMAQEGMASLISTIRMGSPPKAQAPASQFLPLDYARNLNSHATDTSLVKPRRGRPIKPHQASVPTQPPRTQPPYTPPPLEREQHQGPVNQPATPDASQTQAPKLPFQTRAAELVSFLLQTGSSTPSPASSVLKPPNTPPQHHTQPQAPTNTHRSLYSASQPPPWQQALQKQQQQSSVPAGCSPTPSFLSSNSTSNATNNHSNSYSSDRSNVMPPRLRRMLKEAQTRISLQAAAQQNRVSNSIGSHDAGLGSSCAADASANINASSSRGGRAGSSQVGLGGPVAPNTNGTSSRGADEILRDSDLNASSQNGGPSDGGVSMFNTGSQPRLVADRATGHRAFGLAGGEWVVRGMLRAPSGRAAMAPASPATSSFQDQSPLAPTQVLMRARSLAAAASSFTQPRPQSTRDPGTAGPAGPTQPLEGTALTSGGIGTPSRSSKSPAGSTSVLTSSSSNLNATISSGSSSSSSSSLNATISSGSSSSNSVTSSNNGVVSSGSSSSNSVTSSSLNATISSGSSSSNSVTSSNNATISSGSSSSNSVTSSNNGVVSRSSGTAAATELLTQAIAMNVVAAATAAGHQQQGVHEQPQHQQQQGHGQNRVLSGQQQQQQQLVRVQEVRPSAPNRAQQQLDELLEAVMTSAGTPGCCGWREVCGLVAEFGVYAGPTTLAAMLAAIPRVAPPQASRDISLQYSQPPPPPQQHTQQGEQAQQQGFWLQQRGWFLPPQPQSQQQQKQGQLQSHSSQPQPQQGWFWSKPQQQNKPGGWLGGALFGSRGATNASAMLESGYRSISSYDDEDGPMNRTSSDVSGEVGYGNGMVREQFGLRQRALKQPEFHPEEERCRGVLIKLLRLLADQLPRMEMCDVSLCLRSVAALRERRIVAARRVRVELVPSLVHRAKVLIPRASAAELASCLRALVSLEQGPVNLQAGFCKSVQSRLIELMKGCPGQAPPSHTELVQVGWCLAHLACIPRKQFLTAYSQAMVQLVPEMYPVELVMLSWPLLAWHRSGVLPPPSGSLESCTNSDTDVNSDSKYGSVVGGAREKGNGSTPNLQQPPQASRVQPPSLFSQQAPGSSTAPAPSHAWPSVVLLDAMAQATILLLPPALLPIPPSTSNLSYPSRSQSPATSTVGSGGCQRSYSLSADRDAQALGQHQTQGQQQQPLWERQQQQQQPLWERQQQQQQQQQPLWEHQTQGQQQQPLWEQQLELWSGQWRQRWLYPKDLAALCARLAQVGWHPFPGWTQQLEAAMAPHISTYSLRDLSLVLGSLTAFSTRPRPKQQLQPQQTGGAWEPEATTSSNHPPPMQCQPQHQAHTQPRPQQPTEPIPRPSSKASAPPTDPGATPGHAGSPTHATAGHTNTPMHATPGHASTPTQKTPGHAGASHPEPSLPSLDFLTSATLAFVDQMAQWQLQLQADTARVVRLPSSSLGPASSNGSAPPQNSTFTNSFAAASSSRSTALDADVALATSRFVGGLARLVRASLRARRAHSSRVELGSSGQPRYYNGEQGSWADGHGPQQCEQGNSDSSVSSGQQIGKDGRSEHATTSSQQSSKDGRSKQAATNSQHSSKDGRSKQAAASSQQSGKNSCRKQANAQNSADNSSDSSSVGLLREAAWMLSCCCCSHPGLVAHLQANKAAQLLCGLLELSAMLQLPPPPHSILQALEEATLSHSLSQASWQRIEAAYHYARVAPGSGLQVALLTHL